MCYIRIAFIDAWCSWPVGVSATVACLAHEVCGLTHPPSQSVFRFYSKWLHVIRYICKSCIDNIYIYKYDDIIYILISLIGFA